MEPEAVTRSRLIGAILVENGLITRDQLLRALELQERTGERLGEIVVAEFNVPRLELASVLAEQWAALEGSPSGESAKRAPALRVVAAPAPDEPATRRPIGEIFLELGFITQAQLDAALEGQRTSGARIGEILVEQGSLTRLDLASALAEQWSSLEKLRPPSPPATDRNVSPLQDGSAPRDVSGVDSAALSALEGRLAALESTASDDPIPGVADIEAGIVELRAALASLDVRVDEASVTRSAADEIAGLVASLGARLDALERNDVASELEMLRRELGEVSSRSDASEALADVRAAIARLEERPDVASQIESLAAEIAAVTARLDDRTAIGELEAMVEAAAERAETAGIEVRHLAERMEMLSSLGERLDELAARVPAEGALDDLVQQFRRGLSEVAVGLGGAAGSNESAAVASIAARVEQLAARVDDTTSTPELDLEPALDALAARVEATTALSATQAEGLGERIASLEETALAGTGALDRLASELEVLGARTQEQLSELGGRSGDTAPLDDVLRRLDELAASVEQASDAAPLEDIDARVTALAEQHDAIGSLETRIREVESRIPEAIAASELREEIRQVREGTTAERASLTEELMARVEEMTASAPREDELTELRARLDQIASQADQDGELLRRIESLAERIESLDGVEASIADVLESIAGLDARHVADALATDTRLAGLEGALEGLRDRDSSRPAEVERAVTEGVTPLQDRLDFAESRLGVVADLEARLAALTAELERQPDVELVVGELAEVRSRLDELAALPQEGAVLRERVDSIAARLDSVGSLDSAIAEARAQIALVEDVRVADALANGARLAGVEASATSYFEILAELDGRLSALVADLDVRLDDQTLANDVGDLRGRIEHLATQESADELGHRISGLADRAEAIADDARSSLSRSSDELYGRIDELAHALWGRIEELNERLGGLVAREELDAAAARHVEWFQAELVAVREAEQASTARLESLLEHGLAALSARVTEEVAGARAAAQQEAEIVRGEVVSLGARIDEVVGMRYVDLAAGRLADERLAEQLDAVAELRENDSEVARRETVELASRLDVVAGALKADSAAVRAIAEGATVELEDVRRQRGEDISTAELADAELAARLDDLALHTEESARDVERGLREELVALAARVEGHDAAEIEAREELRGELERLASSMGWRLEKIEESLASDDSAALRETVSDLEQRVEGHSARGEEQVKATERALRKGLASLGERLVDSESAYLEAGNTLRRSIERLGAAVVEADARMADQIPVSPLEGCVAFAPTADGYRLVEMPGAPPEVGAIVELVAGEGPLVVTRYGRSPLPFDGRPCAYLDRG